MIELVKNKVYIVVFPEHDKFESFKTVLQFKTNLGPAFTFKIIDKDHLELYYKAKGFFVDHITYPIHVLEKATFTNTEALDVLYGSN